MKLKRKFVQSFSYINKLSFPIPNYKNFPFKQIIPRETPIQLSIQSASGRLQVHSLLGNSN